MSAFPPAPHRSRLWRYTIASLLILGVFETTASFAPAAEPAVDFTRDVRTILSNRCFACHGPDAEERKGGLRLDDRNSAIAPADSGATAIAPGKPDHSELIRRVTSTEDGERMPPPEFGKPLTERETSVLRAWIKGGANYEPHWAYRPLAHPASQVCNLAKHSSWSGWPHHRFDELALEGILSHQLTPAPPADREVLIRRASLDLIGLPPTPEQVESFLNDPRPNAYERLVSRLLADPAYGEHAARSWLDLARYADSAGYADDPPRTIWAYRDWVIRALNANQPFDAFTIDQLAGDLLPDPKDEQLIATAFHRNTLTNNEGGTNDEEFRNVAIVDRVNTTMAVWLGTTMNCAQCHTHKYDPITQEDYFRVFAIFNQSEDADRRDESPLLEVFTDEQKRQKISLLAEQDSLREIINTATPELEQSQRAWEQSLPSEFAWESWKPQEAISKEGTKLEVQEDGFVNVSEAAKRDTFTLILPAPQGEAITGLRLHTEPGHNFVITQVTAHVIGKGIEDDKATPVVIKQAAADYQQTGFAPAGVLDTKDPHKTGWAVGGAQQHPHDLDLLFDKPLTMVSGQSLQIELAQQSQYDHHLLKRFQIALTHSADLKTWMEVPMEYRVLARTPKEQRKPDDETRLSKYYREHHAGSLKPTRDRLAEVEKQLSNLKPITTVPIQRDLPEKQRRVTRLQRRGNFMDLGQEVTPGVPSELNPSHRATEVKDRYQLAQWLINGQNPLTARVIANRQWEALFGQGLVSTSEEFGSQGELPSHPELLDAMAWELQYGGWDLKRSLRELFVSAVYRQSAVAKQEHLEKDPDNRWLARGPRVRLTAEMVRDQALAISGLLDHRIGGAPVRPPQPNLGVNAAFGSAVDWQPSQGGDRYRRGLYTTWRRSNPYPSMTTFDAPNREVCSLKRDRTNTPLQALVTLNDPVYLEAARSLALKVLKHQDPVARIQGMFQECLQRKPSTAEHAALEALLADLQNPQKHPAESMVKLAETAQYPPTPAGITAQELARWMIVANVMLNLDETLMKR